MFTLDPVTVTTGSVWTEMVSQWKPRGSWNNMGPSRAPRRERVTTMRDRKARIPLGVQVHLEQWGDKVRLVDFDSGEHGGGL